MLALAPQIGHRLFAIPHDTHQVDELGIGQRFLFQQDIVFVIFY
jgi:hypothetical protein